MEGATKRQNEAESERLTKRKEQKPGVGGGLLLLRGYSL
jgi:hypothetical protein